VPNGVGVSLARNRRSPKRPSEPRPSGAHPEEDAVKRRCGATASGVFVVWGGYGAKTVGGIEGGGPNWPDELDEFAQIASHLRKEPA